ncbi:hypothetical protein SAMN05192574_102313 [Mucilaginibacter gossypiicola]|uniref:Uncharacterized protein n=1 Tax=Mucilaginibacter gossypiicola TaxID=551995 RepID=A0A1H8DG41_9SPHI|nr:hypothetical protein [Mucilaginibacter gossypiicola]SEN05508.1 hypothetical protein SAMN05192574_102313 [Mucilaginibacter gossypiicola]
MIIHCTWTQYGVTAGACCLLYYLLVLGHYYRQEITAFFHREKGAPPSVTKAPLPDVFGQVRSDDTEMAVISADELAFADNDGGDELSTEPMPDKVFLLGGLADFQQELKTLVRITIESQDTRENFLDLLRLVASGYPPLADQQYIGPIASMLLENSGDFPFELKEADIREALINTSFND